MNGQNKQQMNSVELHETKQKKLHMEQRKTLSVITASSALNAMDDANAHLHVNSAVLEYVNKMEQWSETRHTATHAALRLKCWHNVTKTRYMKTGANHHDSWYHHRKR